MKKIICFLCMAACLMAVPSIVFAQDSLAKSKGYDKIPPMANPKQLNRTDKGGNIDVKGTSSKLPPGAGKPAAATGSDKNQLPPQGYNNGAVPPKASQYDLAPAPKSTKNIYGAAPPPNQNASNGALPAATSQYDVAPAPKSTKNIYGAAPPPNQNASNGAVPPKASQYDLAPAAKSTKNIYGAAPPPNQNPSNGTVPAATSQYDLAPAAKSTKNIYGEAPPAKTNPASNNYGNAPAMANPKQLNRTTASKDLNSSVQQKATNQYGPPPVSGKAASNPYGTLPKKPAGAPDNQIGGTTAQDNYDDIPNQPPVNRNPSTNQLPNSNGYGKVPTNNTKAATTQNKSQYQQIPLKPKNEPDNKIDGATAQDGNDDAPAPTNARPSSNNYNKVPSMANPKQLNRTTAVKDLNNQQQKTANQNTQQPVKNSAVPNPKSQYGQLPPPGRTHQYGTVPPKNTQAPAVNQNNTTKQPVAPAARTHQYGSVPAVPKATTSTPPQKAPPPPPPTYKKG